MQFQGVTRPTSVRFAFELCPHHTPLNDRRVADGVFTAQLARTNDPSTLLPLSVFSMASNPSVCTISGSRPSISIFCNCAVGFDTAPLTAQGRTACTSGPPAPTSAPTLVPTTSAPTPVPTTASPTTGPTFGLSFEVVGTSGCCGNADSLFYPWVRHDNTDQGACEALCVADPNCRGVETPWSIEPAVQGQCFLLLDSGTTPVNSSFAASGIGSAGSVTGVVAVATVGLNCNRNLFQCFRICRAGATNLSNIGCVGVTTTPAPSTAAPTVAPVGAVDRILLSLSVRPSELDTAYWSDLRPPVGNATAPPAFETAVATIVCSERGAVFSESSDRARCTEELRVVVVAITSRTLVTSITTITFYATINGSVVTGPSVLSAFGEFANNTLGDVFQFPFVAVAAQAVATTPAPVASTAKRVTTLTAALVISAVAVVLIILLLVIIFAVMRLRRLRTLVSALQGKSGYSKLDQSAQYPYGPPSAMAQFYGPPQGAPPASHQRPPQSEPLHSSGPARSIEAVHNRPPEAVAPTHSASVHRPDETVVMNAAYSTGPTRQPEPQPVAVGQAAPVLAAGNRFARSVRSQPAPQPATVKQPEGDALDEWEAELRAGMDHAARDLRSITGASNAKPPPISQTSAGSRMTSVKLNFDKPQNVETVAASFELSLPHGAGTSRW